MKTGFHIEGHGASEAAITAAAREVSDGIVAILTTGSECRTSDAVIIAALQVYGGSVKAGAFIDGTTLSGCSASGG